MSPKSGSNAGLKRVSKGMLQNLSNLEAPVVQAGLVDLDGSFVFMLGLFLIFFGVLHVVVIKPMMAAHSKRHMSMGGARDEAEAMDLKAAEAATAYDAKLDAARQEAVKVRDGIKEEGEADARSHLAEVRKKVADDLAAANAKKQATLQKAEGEMEARATELADAIVTRLLGKAGG